MTTALKKHEGKWLFSLILNRGSQAVLRTLREARRLLTAPDVIYCGRDRHAWTRANMKSDERGIVRCLDCRAEGQAKHARREARRS
jgi:hypothetical protein